MGFQSTVRSDIAAGVIGEIAYTGPTRVKPFVLNSADPADNVFGRFFTQTGVEGFVQAGGAGAPAGIMVDPKGAPNMGAFVGGTLAASLALPNGVPSQFLLMGEVFVALPAAAAEGAVLKYNTTTGVIGTGAPGAGEAVLPNGVVSVYDATSPGFLAIVKLTN